MQVTAVVKNEILSLNTRYFHQTYHRPPARNAEDLVSQVLGKLKYNFTGAY